MLMRVRSACGHQPRSSSLPAAAVDVLAARCLERSCLLGIDAKLCSAPSTHVIVKRARWVVTGRPLTGVPTVGTVVAQHLIKTVSAARLMGADCIQPHCPQIAQTIVQLGVELQVVSKATMADELVLALRRVGRSIHWLLRLRFAERKRRNSYLEDRPLTWTRIADAEDAAQLLPAWFSRRMIGRRGRFGLLLTTGDILKIISITALHQSAGATILLDVLLDHAGAPDGVDLAWRPKHYLGAPVPGAARATINLAQVIAAVEFVADAALEQPNEDMVRANDEVEPATGQLDTLTETIERANAVSA
jgi:hypothetical protein